MYFSALFFRRKFSELRAACLPCQSPAWFWVLSACLLPPRFRLFFRRALSDTNRPQRRNAEFCVFVLHKSTASWRVLPSSRSFTAIFTSMPWHTVVVWLSIGTRLKSGYFSLTISAAWTALSRVFASWYDMVKWMMLRCPASASFSKYSLCISVLFLEVNMLSAGFSAFQKIDVLVVCLKIVLHKSRFAVFFYGDGEGQITYAHFSISLAYKSHVLSVDTKNLSSKIFSFSYNNIRRLFFNKLIQISWFFLLFLLICLSWQFAGVAQW